MARILLSELNLTVKYVCIMIIVIIVVVTFLVVIHFNNLPPSALLSIDERRMQRREGWQTRPEEKNIDFWLDLNIQCLFFFIRLCSIPGRRWDTPYFKYLILFPNIFVL